MGCIILWKTKTPGIPDELFDRDEKVQITKEEVRAVQISKGRLKPGMIVYDIGCGSGSMSVEAALQVENSGHVHAVDYDPKAVELTKKNLAKFGVSNVSVIGNNASEAISELPNADAEEAKAVVKSKPVADKIIAVNPKMNM